MSTRVAIAPVRKTVEVPLSPLRAFDLFVGRMADWWPVDYGLLGAARQSIVIEPKTGGRWYERGADGSERDTGYVIAWQSPSRLVFAWQLDGAWQFDPKLVTELEIRFVELGWDRTRIELEHRDLEKLGDSAEATRASLDEAGGWSMLLDRFVALAKSTT